MSKIKTNLQELRKLIREDLEPMAQWIGDERLTSIKEQYESYIDEFWGNEAYDSLGIYNGAVDFSASIFYEDLIENYFDEIGQDGIDTIIEFCNSYIENLIRDKYNEPSISESNKIKNYVGKILKEDWGVSSPASVRSYQDALSELQKGRSKGTKKLDRNTYLILNPEDQSIAVKLHDTNIVTYYKNGTVELNSGGWRSMTTKDRINSFSPVRIDSDGKGRWSVNGELFYDGIKINPSGHMKSTKKGIGTENKSIALEMKVKQYVEGFINALKAGEVDLPSGGDCWDCMAKRESPDHIMSHIKEKYYVPTLLVNAAEKYQNPNWLSYFGKDVFQSKLGKTDANTQGDLSHVYKTIKRCLTKYILNALGIKKS